jgi:YrbI family 3-deoxy-D-manno-octulosonate 8-phosphate phosphatase
VDRVVSPLRTVAIVPARGGSKTIPRKNIRPLDGVPLLAYSIEAGLRARRVDRVIVSTDDEETAEIGRAWGADVPFLRPQDLAGDFTPDLPVFQHALDWLETHEGGIPDIVVQLRPTSPLRSPDCVDAAVDLLCGDETLDSVRAVVPAWQNPYKMWRLQPDGMMVPLLAAAGSEAYNRPRQELPPTYWQTGHVDAFRTRVIRQHGSMSGSRMRPLVLDPAYACDIDAEADWTRTEWLLARFDRPLIRPGARRPLPDDLRLVVFDFDGVMTDNRVWVSEQGDEWVACNRSDGLGLEALHRLGVECLVLSTETNPVVAARCRKLKLACEHGVADKADRLRRLIAERGLTPAQIVYVGNDVNDIGCLRLAGCGVVVADAHPEARRAADIALTRAGGHGAVRELCDRLAALLSLNHRHTDVALR